MQVDITIPGRPVPAQRMTQKSKWSDRAQRSLDYQKQVAWEWKAAAKALKLERPLKLTAKFYFKDKRHGDLSNLVKAIEDGLQYGQAFDNDKQIVRYGESGIYFDDDERAEIVIEELEGCGDNVTD